MTDKQRYWLNAATARGGSFVSTFARACFCADAVNFSILKDALNYFMQKYPNYLDGFEQGDEICITTTSS